MINNNDINKLKMNFSESLRTQTQPAHKKAEQCNLMKSFMDLTVTKEHYQMYLTAFVQIYTKLEEKLPKTSFYFPELNREEAIKRDLDYFKPLTINLNALTAYLAHIEQSDELALIAHSYVRYLGDLSGGFMIQKRIKSAFQLTDKGFDFYVFEVDPIAFKNMYKSKLNDLNLDLDKFVEIANTIFELNYNLFEEIYNI